jgi:hypothetical protein
MRLELAIHRGRCGTQRLGHDLAAVQATPRILRTAADVGVRAVVGELQQFVRIHRPLTLRPGLPRRAEAKWMKIDSQI